MEPIQNKDFVSLQERLLRERRNSRPQIKVSGRMYELLVAVLIHNNNINHLLYDFSVAVDGMWVELDLPRGSH